MLSQHRGPQARQKKLTATAELYLPYTRHVTKDLIALRSRAVMTTIALDGISFETTDTEDLNILQNQLNLLWRNVANEQLAVWTHMVRRRDKDYPDGEFWSPFARDLDAKYKEKMVAQDLYRNQWFVTLIWVPERDLSKRFAGLAGRFNKAKRARSEVDSKSIRMIEDARRNIVTGLERYAPKVLSLYEHDGLWFSEQMEFLRLIGTLDDMRMPLVDGPIGGAVYLDRLLFGREALEIRSAGHSKLGGILGIREYPASTKPGMLNSLLAAPFECVLAQSFAMMSKADAKAKFSLKQGQMINSNDRAFSQIADLDNALDDLESNRFVVGEHHLSLMILADTNQGLLDNMSLGRRLLSDGGIVTAREDLAIETAYWGIFPGLFDQRPRSGAITSKNFSALAGFHTYPTGDKKSHWGDPVALLKTASGCPFNFNFHHGDLGNTFICGPSGSGKTVFQNFALAQLQKHNATMIFFDKDRGADIFVRAAGGTYLPLKTGNSTGCSPLQALDLDDAGDFEFLQHWIKKLVSPHDDKFTVRENQEIFEALNQLKTMPPHLRRLDTIRSFFSAQESEGIGARLERWFGHGALAWVFDHAQDDISLDQKFMGFDMTDFLDNGEIRTPLMMYLFHRVEKLIDGRRIVIDIDEFWKALGDVAFQELAQNKLKTIRKQNGIMVFGTQSPRDAINSEIGHTIIEQCATQIFMPNPKGSHEDYVKGFKLTEREFALIREELAPESRRFLVKQGHNSVVAELNLQGFDDELTVLSGRTETVERMDELIAVHGPSPDQWLPKLLNRSAA